MAKTSMRFVCQGCGHESLRWVGRCPDCSAWGSLVEEAVAAPGPAAPSAGPSVLTSRPQRIRDVHALDEQRASTGIGEFDRVLGGGVVPGSLVLIGGDPGIGKSTLLTQVAHFVAENQGPVLYVSGEESVQQIRLRSDRLGGGAEQLYLLAETDLPAVEAHARDVKPRLLLIDSIQTMQHPDVSSAPGTVTQVRASTSALMQLAKSTQLPVFIVGHVTKEGAIAGPRVLEHIVDTVLYFEGERGQNYRILRAEKNRFGSTNELGIFEMGEAGLTEVANPSEYLLSERTGSASGSVVTATLEGSRPLLVEIQALTVPSPMAAPRRVATGLDFNRLLLLAAVLEKRVGLRLGNQDIFTNVVGGLRIVEPAADLGVALAVASSLKDAPVPPDLVVVGEVGLAGEVRAVGQMDKRLAEAARLGFRRALVSRRNAQRMAKPSGMQLLGVETLAQAVTAGLE